MRPAATSRSLTLSLAALALLAGGARAQEKPPEAPAEGADPGPAPSWKLRLVMGRLAVSRDGKWLAAATVDGLRLLPAAGGEPVALDLGKEQRGFPRCEFTADSKWLVVPCDANAVEVPGLEKDRTQAVHFFATAAPSKRRTIQIQLKAEGLAKDVKRLMDPRYRDMKTLKGSVMDLVPLTGSRMLFDRGSVGVEVWDVAAGSKYAAPPALDGRSSCGLSADGARCVLRAEGGLEIRDVKTNRVLHSIAAPHHAKRGVYVSHPVFAPDGRSVLVSRRTDSGKEGERSIDDLHDHAIECWSTDGKKLWETPVGAATYLDELFVSTDHAVAVLADAVRLLDLRDGGATPHPLDGKKVSCVRPTPDGKRLWAAVDRDVLTRFDLPPRAEK